MSRRDLLHIPSGRGKGKWQNVRSLLRYIAKRKVRNRMAAESRRRNRA